MGEMSFPRRMLAWKRSEMNGMIYLECRNDMYLMNRKLLFITMIVFLCGCGTKESQELISMVQEVKTDGQQVRKYLDKEIYLDVDVQVLSSSINTSSRSADENDEFNKMKAVLYRFYSHVKTIDGKNICSLKDAREINISENLFSILQKNLKAGNDWVERCKEEGKEVVVMEVTDEYLNSLLK